MSDQNIPSAETSRPARRYDLDFVRGVAILLAMGWHFNTSDSGLVVVDLLMIPGRVFGWAGVDLFFVLSGFLVGGLLLSEFKLTGAFDARKFLIRRIFKIWPVLYAYVLLLMASGRYPWQSVVPQIFLHVQNFWVTPVAHLWSLAVEEHFYAGMALLLILRCRCRKLRLDLILLCVLVFSFVLRCLAVVFEVDRISIQYQTQFRIDSLAVGVLLANLRCNDFATFSKLIGRKMLLFAVLCVSVGVLVYFAQSRYFISTVGYSIAYVAAASFLLLVFDVPLFNGGSVGFRFVSWVGVYSYPIYVFQFVPYRLLEAIFGRFLGMMPVGIELLVKYVGAIVFAVVISKLIEAPMMVLRDRLFPVGVDADREMANKSG